MAAQKRIWIVLDHSRPAAEFYDVMYVDLDADGDLAGPMERVVGQAEGNAIRFRLPDLNDPATRAVHTRFTARSLTWPGSPLQHVLARQSSAWSFRRGSTYQTVATDIEVVLVSQTKSK